MLALAESGTSTGAGEAGINSRAGTASATDDIDHAGKGVAVEPPRIGEQRRARLGHIADSPRNARKPRDERGFERVGQDERARVTRRPQIACQRSPSSEGQLTVSEGSLNDAPEASHARVHRSAPGRGQHVEGRLAERLTQHRKQRLGDKRVPDPRGRDNEDALGHRGLAG